MQQAAAEYVALLGSHESTQAGVGSSITMISSVTGEPVSTSSLSNAGYWADNLVKPVRFCDALVTLLQDSPRNASRKRTVSDIVEVGPHSALRQPIQETLHETMSRKKQSRYFSLLNKTVTRAVRSGAGRPLVLPRTLCVGQRSKPAAAARLRTDSIPRRLPGISLRPFPHILGRVEAESRLPVPQGWFAGQQPPRKSLPWLESSGASVAKHGGPGVCALACGS